jgi:uncharacterized protein (DUF2267 family)
MISTVEFLKRVASEARLKSGTEGQVCEVTLRALGEQLDFGQAARLADELPPTMGEWMMGVDRTGDRGLGVLVTRLTRFGPGRLPVTLEQATVVYQLVAQVLRPEILHDVTRTLPPDVGALLATTPR